MTIGNTIITPAAVGGMIGLGYGLTNHYGKDRYDINPVQTATQGLMVGGAIGALAVGTRLKTGSLTQAFNKDEIMIEGHKVSGDAAKILKGMGVT